ncbi:unnamed protein product [Urochloa decumbens]|uniref:Serpin domain-containing protein n=1 Tax=Urochloa decumbens TaxID=240449 RepID=A0ABC8WGZ8_9POAL
MEVAAAATRLASSGPTVLSHRLMKHFAAANMYPAADGACRTAGNLVFSPLSIYSSLSVMAAGARGRTLSELLHVVGAARCCQGGLDEDARGTARHALSGYPQLGGPRVFNSCGLWHDATRTPKLAYAYRNTAAAWGGVARSVDFTKPEEARQQINSWVAEWTDNLVDSILDPAVLGEDTRLMLANAVYFEGRLERSFASKWRNIGRRSFLRLDGSTVDAEFICSDEEQFIATHYGFKVLKMMYTLRDPFHGVPAKAMAALLSERNMSSLRQYPRHSIYIVLPDAYDGLWSLHDKMASSPSFLHEHLPECRVVVGEFRVPKLKISFSTSVKRALQDLGIQTLFSTGAADLADMLDLDGSHEPLFLSDILHKAVLEVDEEGLLPMVPPTKLQPAVSVDFVADHPFAFFVVEEESGAIVLAGHVLDPTQKSY